MDMRRTNEDDSGEELKIVIEMWKSQGSDVNLIDVPYRILHLISRYFPPQDQWKLFASYLGIDRIQTLKEIEGDAKMIGVWPSELVLLYAASNKVSSTCKTFADLISILHEKILRLDALQMLYDSGQVNEFFSKLKFNNVDSKNNAENLHQQHVASEKLKQMFLDVDDVGDIVKRLAKKQFRKGTKYDSANVCDIVEALKARNIGRSTECHVNACVVDADHPLKGLWNTNKYVKASYDFDKKNFDHDVNSGIKVKEDSDNVTVLEADRKPFILLTYASDVNDIVPDLVKLFWKANMGVVAEYVLNGKGILERNPITCWETLFKGCHFVVPVISNQYLSDINRPDDTVQSKIVRFVYDLYTGKYVTDGCLNHIVRPLVTSDVDPHRLNNVNPTLRMRWKLWQETNNLIDLIRTSFEAQV